MAQLPGTLSVDDADVSQGTVLAFSYAVPAAQESDTDWIGIWPDPGDGPVDATFHGSQTTYVYAPGTSGRVTLSSGVLSPGRYLAFFLHDNGYESLAPPVPLQVQETPLLRPPPYVGSFGGRHGAHRGGLMAPAGMSLDDFGHFWVADPATRSVHQFTRRGLPMRTLGRDVLRDPQGVVVHDERVFVVDAALSGVVELDLAGRQRGLIGDGELDRPRGIALAGRRLLVSDVGHNRVARFDLHGRLVGEITTGIHIPHGIAVDGGRTWVVSSSRQFDGDNGVTCYVDGEPTITLGYGQHTVYGGLSNPAHVAVTRRGTVLVTVPDLGFVSRYRPTGPFVGEFGTRGHGLLRYPQGVLVGADGDIYVADTGNGRIARFGGRP